MKHPVSTLDESCGGPALGGVVERDVVRTAVLPAAPEHAKPCAGQDADGVGMMAAPPPGRGVDRRRPRRGMARVVGEAGERLPEAFVARPAKGDAAAEAMAVGAEQIGEDQGIAWITLTACGGVPGAARLERGSAQAKAGGVPLPGRS